jgi:hypothetical protein
MLAGLAALTMPFPWVGVALLPLAWAAVESVRAMRAMRAGDAAPGAQAWTMTGFALILLMMASVGWPFIFFGASMEYQRCLEGANTGPARAECRMGVLDQVSPGGGVPFPLGR